MFLIDFYKWLETNTTGKVYPEFLDNTIISTTAVTYSLQAEEESESSDGFVNGACEAQVAVVVWSKDNYINMLDEAKNLRDKFHSMRGTTLDPSGDTRVSHARIITQASDFEPKTGFYMYILLVEFTYNYT